MMANSEIRSFPEKPGANTYTGMIPSISQMPIFSFLQNSVSNQTELI
jgi:membrane protein insertase Oxa1/YidC/SpoIIIJ